MLDIEYLVKQHSILSWDSRKEYREIRKSMPHLNLPSDSTIQKEWGTFTDFSNKLKQHKEEFQLNEKLVNPQQCTLNKKEFVYYTLSLFDVNSVSRREYRQKRITDEQLWSCNKITNEFGSFSDFKKKLIEAKKIINQKSVNVTKEDLKDLINDEDQIIKFIYTMLQDKIPSRNWYRQKRKQIKNITLPSCNRIDKVFGSFSKFKEQYEIFINKSKKPSIEEQNSPEYMQQLRQKVKEKRRQLFGNVRKYYQWESKAKAKMGLMDLDY